MHQPPWMCNDPNCAFRNRLLADARRTTPHVCSQPTRVPVFVNPFPPPKPITILPPPPLAPAPPRPFYFPPPGLPQQAPPTFFPMPGPPVPMMPPAPMPPGPYMLPTAPAPLALPAAPAPPPPEQKPVPPASPDPPMSPSIASVIHDNRVHKLEPKKGPISKLDKEALSDFEESTRRQRYCDLAESSKQQSQSEATQPPSKLRPILKQRQAGTPVVNQEVCVKVYNGGQNCKAEAKNNAIASSPSTKSVPAKDAASIREEAIQRAHSLAHGIATATAPAAIMSGALGTPSTARSCAGSKAPSRASANTAPRTPPQAPSQATKADGPNSAPSNASRSTIGAPTQKSDSTRSESHLHRRGPLALAAATANAQVTPLSIEAWRKSVKRPIPALLAL